MKKILLLFIFIPFFSACSGIPETNPKEPLNVKTGNEFKIVLGSNPTTGYHWEIINHPDQRFIEFVDEEYEPDDKIFKAAGSGGKSVFIFEAICPGQVFITFGYFGPYENIETNKPYVEISFDIIIEN